MIERTLRGKDFIVTAANSDIGQEIVNALLCSGASVLATTRGGKSLDIENERLFSLEADLLSTEDCDKVASAATKLKNFSGLVHVAGAWIPGSLSELSGEDFDRAFSSNLRTAFNICKVTVPLLVASGGGSVITIGSMIATSPVPKSLAYSSSKAALIQFTRSLALDEGSNGIRCNCICPGLVKTAQTRNVFDNEDWVAQITQSYPLGRLGRPEDISGLVCFLLGDSASWMTGLAIPVEGGYLISAESP